MKTAGMFREFGGIKHPEPQDSIFDHVSPDPLPDVDRVVAYLQAGHVLIDFMDVADDVFDRSRQILGGPTTRTDGDYLWRDDLAYYVERHNVALPDDFLRLIRARHYIVPDLDDPTLDRAADEAVHLMS
jgi:hypothetical protein